MNWLVTAIPTRSIRLKKVRRKIRAVGSSMRVQSAPMMACYGLRMPLVKAYPTTPCPRPSPRMDGAGPLRPCVSSSMHRLTAGQGYIREMPLAPCGIDGGKRDLMGGCAVINLDKILKSLLIRLKISQSSLPSIYGLFDYIRPPPIPLQFINGAVSIR